ncbi:hypothetical protein A2Z33_02125 [Candidatus Gottesmanbacteria bacterium RBG_16_52_11]|uniref:Uncharacterized protein n=1 Tax=Candidatus Gottesmanbacteria bacterium RBG_16_52_11 TaxID=1798374 RepID=A0A1F5YR17_9BACT|nr:MAG: hypothetical protein A2Z33_02125 [Candidatus Gottesmanbacteria bacterium RBG_16_52_11]
MEAPTEPIPLPPEYREVGNKQNPEAFRMQVHRRRGMPVPAELGGAAESPEAAELPEDSVSVRLNTESRIPAGTYPLLDTIRRKMTGEGSGTSAAVRDYTVRCLVAAGAIPEDVYAKWKRETGLSDFRMRLFLPQAHLQRYGGDTAGTVRNAGVIFKIKMGWDACLETAETIPNQLAGLTGNGVVVVYDPPGQFMSTFARPERIRDDPYLATVSEYNLAEDRSLGLFGLSDRQLSDVPVVTIGHSRGAAAAMHEGGNSWQADNRGYVLLAPS